VAAAEKGREGFHPGPKQGEKKRLLDMAATNARLALDQIKAQSAAEQSRVDTALRQLAERLDMPDNLLSRIEAYDISNVRGGTPWAA
jgi:excinuclease ABC subunit C